MVALHQNTWPWIFLLLAVFAIPSLPGTWQSLAPFMSQEISPSQCCLEGLRTGILCRWSIHVCSIKYFCFYVEVEEFMRRGCFEEKQSDLQMSLLFGWLFNLKQFTIKLTFFRKIVPKVGESWEMGLL